MNSFRKTFLIACALFVIVFAARSQEAPELFDYWKYYSDAENALYKHFCDIGFEQLAERKAEVATLDSRYDWQQRQARVRRMLKRLIGAFPQKTPLNARITGKLRGDGFRVEKILFESMPGFPVSAALFIPDGVRKGAPAVLYCCGHTANGFRSETYQHVIINLARKGFVVLAFDPIGQGERRQFYDPEEGKSPFGSTREHSYPGSKCFVAGHSPALYFVWDGIRAIDYLLTRVEVDPGRIGVTGRSGGGTQSAYIGAVDDRVLAAAPENFITDIEHLWKSRGPQDAEQNFLGTTAAGIDHADLIELRAPKSTMLIATTRDIFSIEGTTHTYLEAKRAFESLGAPQNLTMVQDDDGHASTRANREALYAFFREHLSNPGPVADEEVALFDESALNTTGEGNLYPNQAYEDLHSLNLQAAEKELGKLEARRGDPTSLLGSMRSAVAMRSGADMPVNPRETIYSGTTSLDGVQMDAYLLQGTGDYWIPVLVYRPAEPSRSVVLHVSDAGKSDQGMDLRLARDGHTVYAADLPGTGELGPGYLKGDAHIQGYSYNQWYAAMMTGGSIAGLQASDLGALYRMAVQAPEPADPGTVLISEGTLVPAALHAAFMLHDGLDALVAVDGLVSYADMMYTRDYEPGNIPGAVPDVLEAYDLPDLVKAADMHTLLVRPRRADGRIADEQFLHKAYFEGTFVADRQQLVTESSAGDEQAVHRAIAAWLDRTMMHDD